MTSIAFLTSGGDSPGMNAAIRAITRFSLNNNISPYAIFNGFAGLLEDSFRLFDWSSVSYILTKGGTYIKSSRCKEFMDKSFRKSAVFNLSKRKISLLIVIGGDGSITGAQTLFNEWEEHLLTLKNEGLIDENIFKATKNFSIVGLAGSIDNDIYGTEMCIGADTALWRVVNSLDCISCTAGSHSRAFVVEVMGRKCGWLALNAFIASNADAVFLPEVPISDDWNSVLIKNIQRVCFFKIFSAFFLVVLI